MELYELKDCSYKPSKMTREEEIIKQAEIYTGDASNLIEWSDGWEDYDDYEYVKKAFINGAKWADETMIEKAIQQLFENVYDYLNPEDQERVESFRKAMEK